MDAKFIIQEGDVAKYQMLIEHEDFDMMQDEFEVTLSWGMLGESMTVSKSEMVHDEDGNWFLIFNSSGMVGKVTAECRYLVPDSDMADGVREEVDRQYIGFVTANPCPQFACECECPTHEEKLHVTYTRVWRSDVNTLYLNLRTTEENGEHRPILDSEGKKLRVRKEEKDIY